ncbi:hypothetical protein EON77_09765, partial [bacterium]
MATKTKEKTPIATSTTPTIADLATEFEIKPGQVYGTLSDLGIEHDGATFTADADTVELIRESLLEQVDKKTITLKPGATPRDVALALGLPMPELQKTLISKYRIMKAVGNALTDEELAKIVEGAGYELAFASAPKPRAPRANGKT